VGREEGAAVPETLDASRLRSSLASSEIPAHMHDGLIRYLADRVEPGSFLRAVLCCDMDDARRRADAMNIVALRFYWPWLINNAPSDAWGSRHNVEAWLVREKR
jgi:hypothetical protein